MNNSIEISCLLEYHSTLKVLHKFHLNIDSIVSVPGQRPDDSIRIGDLDVHISRISVLHLLPTCQILHRRRKFKVALPILD